MLIFTVRKLKYVRYTGNNYTKNFKSQIYQKL